MPQLNRPKSTYVLVLDVMITNKEGHITMITSEKNLELHFGQAVDVCLRAIYNAGPIKYHMLQIILPKEVKCNI